MKLRSSACGCQSMSELVVGYKPFHHVVKPEDPLAYRTRCQACGRMVTSDFYGRNVQGWRHDRRPNVRRPLRAALKEGAGA